MKRIFTMLMVIMMMAAVTGCNRNTEGNTEGVPTLTWYVPSDNQPDKDTVMAEANKIIEEKIGAKLDLRFLDYGAFETRMQTMMAAATEYDLCFTGYMNDYNEAATKGGLLDITDLIDKEAPKLRELIPDWLFKSSEVNGRLYAVPNIQIVASPDAIWIADHVAERINFEFPEPCTKVSITDFEPFMEEVKKLREKTGEEIYNFPGINSFYADKYELIAANVAIRKDGSSKEAVIIYETPEFQEGVKKIREWYKKGYIRPDIATADLGSEQTLGRIGLDLSTWKPGAEVNMANAYGFSSKAYFVCDPYVGYNKATSTMIGIGKDSKNPEKAIKLIELMNSDKELYNLICFGIEGKHYTFTDEGKVKLIENSGYYPNHQWKYGNQFNAFVLDGMDIDVYKETERLNNESMKSPLLGFTLDKTPINNEIAQISSVQGEYQSFEKGFDDPDNYMAEFKRRMEAAGQRKILEEVQRQIDEFFAANK